MKSCLTVARGEARYEASWDDILDAIALRLFSSTWRHFVDDGKKSSQLVSKHFVTQLIEQHPELLRSLSSRLRPLDKYSSLVSSRLNPSGSGQSLKD